MFLNSYIKIDIDSLKIPDDIGKVTDEQWLEIEADSYWCLSKIMDGIQDNYTQNQPGVKKCYTKISEIMKRLDNELFMHLESETVEFYTIAFKWLICLLLRQFSPKMGLRLFDTYISDDKGYSIFCIYIFVAIILKFSKKLKKMKFEEIMLFLQQIPTKYWQEDDVKMIISEAYSYKLYFDTNSNL